MLTLAMVAAVTFADDPILILGPALAHQLNASSDWTGYFLSALGLGTILGSFRIGAKKRASKHRTWQPTATSDRSRRAARFLLLLVACMFIFASGSDVVSLLAAFGAGVAAPGPAPSPRHSLSASPLTRRASWPSGRSPGQV